MAPEQARGGPDVDERADVYSLGCVLFECLTGVPPFAGASPMAVLSMLLMEEAPLLRSKRPDLPAPLEGLVARMLAKEPGARLRNGAAVAAALAALGPVDAARPGATSVRSPSIGASELRVVTLALISMEESDARSPVRAALTRVALEHAAVLEPLAEDSFVATVPMTAASCEQARRTARFALAVQVAVPDAVLVLATGRGLVLDGHPVGEVIDRGIRMLGRAKPMAIRIDETTAVLIDPRFRVEAVGDRLLLSGEREDAAAARQLRRAPTPFVGRVRELELLTKALESCSQEHRAHAIVCAAPAGAGKSRLREEFLSSLGAAPHAMDIVFAEPRTCMPLGMFVDIFARMAQAASSPERKSIRLQASRVLDALAATMRGEHDQPARRQKVAAECLEVLRAACEDRTLVLVLEDLQWFDDASIRLLGVVLDELHERRLFVLACARTVYVERHPGLWGQRARIVDIAPLPRKDAEAIASARTRRTRSEISAIVDAAAGNPYVLEELADATDTEVPDTIVSLLQAELDVFGAEARRALRAASFFGERFRFMDVHALLGWDPKATTVALDELARHGMIERAGAEDYLALRPLLVRVAHATLTDEDKALGSRLVYGRRSASS
jgi:hypothetical protein